MEKEFYIEQEKVTLNQSFAATLFLAGIPVILILSLLDLFVTPENFRRFLIYRAVTALIFVLFYFVIRLKRQKSFQIATIILATFVVSAMVELMILSLGGHQSIYYAGMIIVLIFIFGFLPLFSFKITFLLALIAYSTYVLPILLFDHITNIQVFVSNNVFLLASISIGVMWRHYNDKLLISKLSLEYDLSQEKERLKEYSTHLEELVAQRTRELAISEQKYRGLFDNASDGVAVYDTSGAIINVNHKFCEQHGFPVDALIGTNIRTFEADKDDQKKDERIRRIAGGESLIYEARHVHRTGDTILFEVSAKALDIGGHTYIQAFHRDISDKKRIQEQLFQSQKMDSIGMLAGGIAHDFNNVISAIIGHIELMGLLGNLDAEARKRLAVIESSSRRASQMITRLLRFARKESMEKQPINLNSVVADTYELIGKTLSNKNVKVSLELDETIPAFMGDANQMEQVIINLMVNAGDSMPSGGMINVKTAFREIGVEASTIHPLLVPKAYLELTISDTGTGIPDNIRNRIFDPFFTTKDRGKGTGLGLAMVYGIIKEHEGVITVAGRPGKGTAFTVYVPAAQAGQMAQTRPAESGENKKGGILVIEDNREMLLFVAETVKSLGYEVRSVNNAVVALQIFKEHSPDISLVITDIFMPLIDGRDLVKNIKSIKPSIKIISMSAYQIEEFVKQDSPVDAFLRKPFGRLELISEVNKLMQPSRYLHT